MPGELFREISDVSGRDIASVSEKQYHIRYSSKRGKICAFKTDIMKDFLLYYVWEEVCGQYYKTGLSKDSNIIYADLLLPCWYLPLIQI